MKKLLLLPFLLLIAVACSTDNDELLLDESAAKTAAAEKILPPIGACYSSLTASIVNTGGLTNPVWKFTADIPTPVASGQAFQVYLEYQATDCEDITTGIGSITSVYGGLFTNPNSVLPFVQATPGQLLPCYRWRLKIYGVSGKQYSTVNCWQYTPWYDAPIS